MNWIHFPLVVLNTSIFWIIATAFYLLSDAKRYYTRIANIAATTGILLVGSFIISLWITLERPPLSTLGETRLWYSFFLSLIGLITFLRWRYRWFVVYSLFLAMLFLAINYFKPETYSKTLMPALQSVWFVPHVIVYIFAYALLAVSSIVAVFCLYNHYFKNKFDEKNIIFADNLVYIGFAFLTLGLLFGALWAKEAWGHYWTWDPKETWAFLTWIVYLIYIHYRHFNKNHYFAQLWILSLAFVVLLMCWFGINSLAAAQNSVHIYSN